MSCLHQNFISKTSFPFSDTRKILEINVIEYKDVAMCHHPHVTWYPSMHHLSCTRERRSNAIMVDLLLGLCFVVLTQYLAHPSELALLPTIPSNRLLLSSACPFDFRGVTLVLHWIVCSLKISYASDSETGCHLGTFRTRFVFPLCFQHVRNKTLSKCAS
jgi:hypothetical protein